MGKTRRKAKAKGFVSGFKDFITKGNIIDLAVAVIIGGAFGKIVSSLVNDIIMPPIGALIGGVNFSDLIITIKEATGDVAAVTINYGLFIQHIIEFLIIAFSIYSVITLVIRRRQFQEEIEASLKEPVEEEDVVEEVVIPEDILLLTEIRDHLKELSKKE